MKTEIFNYISAARRLGLRPLEVISKVKSGDLEVIVGDDGINYIVGSSIHNYLNPIEESPLIEVTPVVGMQKLIEDVVENSKQKSKNLFNRRNFSSEISEPKVDSRISVPRKIYDESEMEEKVLGTLHKLLLRKGKSVHSVYSNFNSWFRKNFPDYDPVEYTTKLQSESKLISKPRKGGVAIFPPVDELSFIEVTDHEELELLINRYLEGDDITRYDYPNKKLNREREISFLENNILITPKTSLVYLSGPQALEQPYFDGLNIRRENVTSVERKIAYAELIKRDVPGINLFKGELSHFVSIDNNQKDAYLIDYDGYVKEDTVRILEKIVRRQLLKDKSVLMTNYFGNREQEEQKFFYLEPLVCSDLDSFKLVGGDSVTDHFEDDIIDQKKENGYHDLRDNGIIALSMKILMGKDTFQLNERVLRIMPDEMKEKFGNYHDSHHDCNKDYAWYIGTNDLMRKGLMEYFIGEEQETLAKLVFLVGVAESQPYFITNLERNCYYTKDGHNLFYTDMFALDRKAETLNMLIQEEKIRPLYFGEKNVEEYNDFFNTLKLREQNRLTKIIDNAYDEISNLYRNFFLVKDLSERRLLGDGKKKRSKVVEVEGLGTINPRVKKKRKLSKDDKVELYHMFSEGSGNYEAVKERFNISSQQYAAFKQSWYRKHSSGIEN